MADRQICDHCHEEFQGEPVRRGERCYCCEACAFEATRSKDCGGRADTSMSQSNTEVV